MSNKKFFAFQLIFALLLTVSFSGCTDDVSDSEYEVTDTVESDNYDSQSSSSSNTDENLEIKELIGNQDEIWSYSYEYTMKSKVGDQNIEVNGSGIIDTKNKKTYLSLKSNNGSFEYYYLDNTIYMGSFANGETQWMKMPSDSEDFENNFDVMLEYNENIHDLENNDFTVEGEETVNGVLCYKIRLNVEDMINDMVAQYDVEDSEVSDFEEADVIYYISKSDGYLVKSVANIKGTDKSGESFEVSYTLSLKNINEVQDIQLPEEAENAVDMSSYYSNYQ